MKCSTCGAFVPADSVFCLECGAQVSDTTKTNTSDYQTPNMSSAGMPTMRVFDRSTMSSISTSTPPRSTHSASAAFSAPHASQIPQPYMPPPPPSADMPLSYSANYTITTVPNSNLAIVSLIFGILAWMMIPLIGSLVAIITGHMARQEIRRSQGAVSGDSMAIAGLVLGYVQLAITALMFCVFIALFLNYFSVSAYFFNTNHFASIITAQGII